LVLPWLELPAHAFRALESCRHAGEGPPCCPVTSSGTSSAANGRAGEQYQVKARYQVRANALLPIETRLIDVYVTRFANSQSEHKCPRTLTNLRDPPVGLYQIFLYFQSFVHGLFVLSFFRPACIAHAVATLLHDCWAVYRVNPKANPPVCIQATG